MAEDIKSMIAKDSFDRFGYDLMGEVFQFLPLKDCFKLAYMNHHVQEAVFDGITYLDVRELTWDFPRRNLRKIEKIIKECAFLKYIEFPLNSIKSKHYRVVFHMLNGFGLRNICPEFHKVLKSEEIRFAWFSDFVRDHGSTIKELNLSGMNTYPLMHSFSGIDKLKDIDILDIRDIDSSKLKSISMICWENSEKGIENLETLNRGLVRICVEIGLSVNFEVVLMVLEKITLFKDLEFLELARTNFEKPYQPVLVNKDIYYPALIRISKSCTKLKYLDCCMRIEQPKGKDCHSNIQLINHFKELKTLKLTLYCFGDEDEYDYFSPCELEIFKVLDTKPTLKYLKIKFYWNGYEACIKGSEFENVFSIFPNLQFLQIDGEVHVSEKFLDLVCESKLRRFYLNSICGHFPEGHAYYFMDNVYKRSRILDCWVHRSHRISQKEEELYRHFQFGWND